ncbi:MAG: PKD domain-containing protein [Fimbriimonadales bacterium]
MTKLRHFRSWIPLLLVFSGTTSIAQLQLLPGDNQIGNTAGTKANPAVASGNGVTLVVWSDVRSNPYGSYYYETAADIYGIRLDASGNPIDSMPFPICTAKSAQTRPVVSWNGTNFLVAFQSVTLHGTGYYYQDCLEAVRVTPQGAVLDQKPIRITGFVPSGYGFTVASDGLNWVVCNQGTATSNSVFAMRISPDGVVLDPPTKRVVQETYYQRSNFMLAYANGVFMLTFQDRYNNGSYTTGFVRFDRNMNLLDTTVRTLNGTPLLGLAGHGANFYATWIQDVNFTSQVFGSRVSTAGSKMDGGVNISQGNTIQGYTPVGLDWDGINWRAFWGSAGGNRIAKINENGVLLTPGGVLFTGIHTGLAAGVGNGSIQFANIDVANPTFVTATLVNDANQTNGDLSIANSMPRQTRADIAAGDNGFMLVYASDTSNGARILAQPLNVNGFPTTVQPIEIATGAGTAAPSGPSVAFSNGNYLVAWASGSGVMARRMLQDGTLLEANATLVMTQAFGVTDIASNGGVYLVVARKVGSYHEIINAVGRRVNAADGSFVDGGTLVLGGIYVANPPAVVPIADKFLVAYHSNVSHDNSMASTMGVFVPVSGAKGTEFSIHGPFSTGGGNGIFEVGLGSNGTVAMMVQSQEITSGVENDMLCRFIDSNGNVSAYKNLTPWDGNQYRPRVSWDGTNFVIAFQEQKNRETFWTLDPIDARSDLFGMRVSPNGTVIDPFGFAISAEDFAETDPTVVCRLGATMFAGSLMRLDSPYQNYRIHKMLMPAGNQYPVAVINPGPTGGDIPLTINFTSNGSYDPDGNIAAYDWDFGDGSTSTAPNPSHTFTFAGPFTVSLTVTDNLGLQTKQVIKVRAKHSNILPVAIARAEPPKGKAPMDVVFYADMSYDPDGFIGNIRWVFSDGGEYWGAVAYHSYPVPGNYTVTMTVWDDAGASSSVTIPIGVLRGSPGAIKR